MLQSLKRKKPSLVQLSSKKESPRSVIGPYFDTLLYGNHAYGNVINGNKTTVSKLTMNDLKDFYNTNYKANGAAISVVGDFDSNNMKAD
jgi:predicted Zn-dependent peptidase